MKQYLENRSKEFSFEGCVLFYSMWESYKKIRKYERISKIYGRKRNRNYIFTHKWTCR